MRHRPLRLLTLVLSLCVAFAGGTTAHAACTPPACASECSGAASSRPDLLWDQDTAPCSCEDTPSPRCDVQGCRRAPEIASSGPARRLGAPPSPGPLSLAGGVGGSSSALAPSRFPASASPVPPIHREPAFRTHCALLC
ncbi:MAG: hypothetical protein HZB55_00180 [Deltaproteobacteria bacterium]|nr:hypothetical protein [Deltaproteobacteria bacterium]